MTTVSHRSIFIDKNHVKNSVQLIHTTMGLASKLKNTTSAPTPNSWQSTPTNAPEATSHGFTQPDHWARQNSVHTDPNFQGPQMNDYGTASQQNYVHDSGFRYSAYGHNNQHFQMNPHQFGQATETYARLANSNHPYVSHDHYSLSAEIDQSFAKAPATPATLPSHNTQPRNYQHNSSNIYQDLITNKLKTIVRQNRLESFYPSDKLSHVINRVQQVDFQLTASQWHLSQEMAYDLAVLALYDIVFFCDDSGSMMFEEHGERVDDLKYILSKVAEVATLFDEDGIVVRFMNSNVEGNGVRNSVEATHLLSQVYFSGATPLGTHLNLKVIEPMILQRARSNTLDKPVMVVVITDGEPIGEKRDKIVEVIRNAKHCLDRTKYGRNALAIQIAQVGKDTRAQKFLAELDNHRSIGGLVDCTSYYELEAEEFARKGVDLTPELWLLKVCLGAIDKSYDEKD